MAMPWSSDKNSTSMAAFPFSIYRIIVSVGGLALFLILGSCLLISFPIGPAFHGYLFSVNSLEDSFTEVKQIDSGPRRHRNLDLVDENSTDFLDVVGRNTKSNSNSQVLNNVTIDDSDLEAQTNSSRPLIQSKTEETKDNEETNNVISSNVVNNVEGADIVSLSLLNDSNSIDMSLIRNNSDVKPEAAPNASENTVSNDSGCDLYHGTWVHDSAGPLYANDSCPVLTQMQNCQGNGRPDKDYENWRWKPAQCDLPRFDGKKFLELMKGKTIAFIGDSVARNQMESLLCILWQVEVPRNRGNKKMQKYYFASTGVNVVRIWSSWLVKQTSEPLSFAPEGVTKLHLDAPDDVFMEFVPHFDVIVLSSGHWFAKQSVYVLNNEIVGGQLWWLDKSRPMKINNIDAFGISVETIMTALGSHRDYAGLVIVRTYSPDHYEGGAWNTGGSCTGKERPLEDGKLVENGFTKIMHEKQVSGFLAASKKITNKSKQRLMDITEAFGYRHDGHPGPYRNTDPNKITKRRPDGSPPPQDCLHWCMPGPVDTWNEIVLEIIRREFEGDQNPSS